MGCASTQAVEPGDTIRATFLPDASVARVTGRLVAVDADSFRVASDDSSDPATFARREVAELERESLTMRNTLQAVSCTGIGVGLASLFFNRPETELDWVGWGLITAVLAPGCVRPRAWEPAAFPFRNRIEDPSLEHPVDER